MFKSFSFAVLKIIGSAKEWFLGWVNSPQVTGFTQHRDHTSAEPCMPFCAECVLR